jgi:hypothetical protein
LLGLDMPSALPCLARFCTPDMVGGMVILPSMSHLVYSHHHHQYHHRGWAGRDSGSSLGYHDDDDVPPSA